MAEDPSPMTETVDKGKGKGRWRFGGKTSSYGKGDGGNMWRTLSQFIVVLLALVALTVLILWLVYHPQKPKFALVNAAVFNLNTSAPPFISTTMQFTVLIRNPNNRMSIFCDHLSAFLSYRNQIITPPLSLPPLDQQKDSSISMSPVLGGVAVPVALEVANDLLMDMEGYGVVQLRLVLQGRIRWKAGAIKTTYNDLYVSCDMLLGLKKGIVGQVPLLVSNPGNDEDEIKDHRNCKVDV